jgi:hypothetical protein
MNRYWINQPSTLQICHKLNGVNVLAEPKPGERTVTVYFLSGEVISQLVPREVLSPGWRTKK